MPDAVCIKAPSSRTGRKQAPSPEVSPPTRLQLSPLAAAAAPPTPAGIALPGGNLLTQVPGEPPRIGGDPSGMRTLGGSEYPQFNQMLLNETVKALVMPASDADAADRVVATAAALSAFKPVDEIEGMIAAQAVAMHFTAMECIRRSMLPGQNADVASKLRKDGANMARAMTDMLDALDRKRGKGPQVVRVERVVVHEGGQAIVGNVQPPGRLKAGGGEG